MLIALFSLLSLVAGAALHYLSTRSHEEQKHYRLLQTQAYADYVRCVAEAAHLSLRSDEADLFARLADAKTRICLYGSQKVVTLLAAFENEGAMLVNAQQRQAFLRLVQAMRVQPTDQVSDLEIVLFREK